MSDRGDYKFLVWKYERQDFSKFKTFTHELSKGS